MARIAIVPFSQINILISNKEGKEGNVLFNETLNTFFLRLYGVRHMVKDNSDRERGNPLPHGLLFLISSKGSFICTIPPTGYNNLCYTSCRALAGTRNSRGTFSWYCQRKLFNI